MKFRKEYDSIGSINVPVDKYWGASTQRSKKYFDIGDVLVRPKLIKSIAIIKKAAAITNFKNKDISSKVYKSIVRASNEVITGKLDKHFPLLNGSHADVINYSIIDDDLKIELSDNTKTNFRDTNKYIGFNRINEDSYEILLKNNTFLLKIKKKFLFLRENMAFILNIKELISVYQSLLILKKSG